MALPSDVAVADLMPNLLELTLVAASASGAAYGGWCLSRVGAPELDSAKSLAAQNVLDGELLHLRQRKDKLPAPIYDEIVDAIAAASAESSSRWNRRPAHHLGVIVAGVALFIAAFSLFLLPAAGTAVPISVGSLVLLIAIASAVSRAGGDLSTAILLASAALPMAVVAGLRAVPTDPPGHLVAPNYLLASTALLVTAILAPVAVGAGGAVCAAAGTVGALGAAVFGVAGFATVPGASFAAGLSFLACVLLLFVPRLAARFAALPIPLVPSSAADLTDEVDPDFDEIIRRSGIAQTYLTGLYTGCAVVIGASAVLLALHDGLWSWILAFAALGVLLLRSRSMVQTPQVLAVLLPGLSAGLICLALSTRLLPAGQAIWVPIGGALLAAIAIAIGVILPSRRFPPTTRRLVDLLEALLITALLPVALAVMDLYQALRHL